VLASDVQDYNRAKPQVEALVRQQEKLCNRFLKEAEDLLQQLHPEDGSNPTTSKPSSAKPAGSSSA